MRPISGALVAFLALFSPLLAAAADSGVGVEQAWSRATTAANGAIYLTLVNHGAAADRLVGVSSAAAAKVELHESAMAEGVMRMRQVEAIEIAPGEQVMLAPGGLHVMLMGLSGPLVEGGTVPLTLRFESGVETAVDAMIMAPGAAMGPAGHGQDHGSGHGAGKIE